MENFKEINNLKQKVQELTQTVIELRQQINLIEAYLNFNFVDFKNANTTPVLKDVEELVNNSIEKLKVELREKWFDKYR